MPKYISQQTISPGMRKSFHNDKGSIHQGHNNPKHFMNLITKLQRVIELQRELDKSTITVTPLSIINRVGNQQEQGDLNSTMNHLAFLAIYQTL